MLLRAGLPRARRRRSGPNARHWPKLCKAQTLQRVAQAIVKPIVKRWPARNRKAESQAPRNRLRKLPKAADVAKGKESGARAVVRVPIVHRARKQRRVRGKAFAKEGASAAGTGLVAIGRWEIAVRGRAASEAVTIEVPVREEGRALKVLRWISSWKS